MSREDGTSRVCDKNQVKVLKERPKHLILSWHRKGIRAVADYDSFEIENSTITNDESESDNLFQLDPTMETRMQGLLEHREPVVDGTNDDVLFTLGDSVQTRMQALLSAASVGNDEPDPEPTVQGQTTRSHGLNLKWNPTMNSKDVIIEKD